MLGDDSTLVKRVAEVPEERAVKVPSDCLEDYLEKKSESVKDIYR